MKATEPRYIAVTVRGWNTTTSLLRHNAQTVGQLRHNTSTMNTKIIFLITLLYFQVTFNSSATNIYTLSYSTHQIPSLITSWKLIYTTETRIYYQHLWYSLCLYNSVKFFCLQGKNSYH